MAVGMCQLDEAQDDLGGDRTAGFEFKPGAEWEAEALGQERLTILTEHLLADLTDSDGQVQVVVLFHGCPCQAVTVVAT
jgi:hypothetical protein